MEWLEDYWWIVVIVAVVIIVIIIALPLTYRKKKPIKRILRRASTLRRQPAANNAVADAQAGGIGTSRQRVARRQQRGERQQVLTASMLKELCCSHSTHFFLQMRVCSALKDFFRQLIMTR